MSHMNLPTILYTTLNKIVQNVYDSLVFMFIEIHLCIKVILGITQSKSWAS